MDITTVLIVAFVAVIGSVVGYTAWASARRRKAPRHQGPRKSQRGRVYKHGTNHSSTPDSW